MSKLGLPTFSVCQRLLSASCSPAGSGELDQTRLLVLYAKIGIVPSCIAESQRRVRVLRTIEAQTIGGVVVLVYRKHSLKVRLKRLARKSFLWIRHPRRVTCYQCGFLSFGNDEVTFQHRRFLASGEEGLSVENLRCFLSCWTEYGVYGRGEDIVRSELESDRRDCPGFFRHREGWAPNEHRELLSKRWETKRQFFLTVLGAAVGSAFALLVRWLLGN